MKVTPLNELSQLEDGELVMRVEGEITRVFDRKSGTKNDKEWSIQNFMLKDDSGEVRVAAWNHDDLSSLGGKKVSITAHKSDKGFSGVYCELNEYKGKTTKQLRLTYSARIERLDGQQSADSSNKESSSTRPNSSQGSRQPTKNQSDSSVNIDDLLMQAGNALYKVMEATTHRWEQMIVDGLVPKDTQFIGNPHFQADCSIAWGYLKDHGAIAKLSTHPVWRESRASRFVKSPMTQPAPDDDEIPF